MASMAKYKVLSDISNAVCLRFERSSTSMGKLHITNFNHVVDEKLKFCSILQSKFINFHQFIWFAMNLYGFAYVVDDNEFNRNSVLW